MKNHRSRRRFLTRSLAAGVTTAALPTHLLRAAPAASDQPLTIRTLARTL
ncbi:MAG TPA: hypothetical protein P5026_09370 [Kiritimatiellia bacterium]|nr:hypothetical protein [Kiritimatiellia bacterium]HRU70872.1 hypothetical protein [Kiritimatiellia bacterium]